MDKYLLVGLELKVFRKLCQVFFDQMGFRAAKIADSSEAEVSDLAILYSKGTDKPFSIFQCTARSGEVDAGLVEKFHTAMTAAGMTTGYFLALGSFSQAAVDFAGPNKINLIDLEKFIGLVGKMPESSRNLLTEVITGGEDESEHKTAQHNCPKCGSKMQLKVSKEGRYKTGKYWLCPMPECGHIVAYF